MIACGPGVERVAEEFAHFFPEARYAIASSDTLHGPAETQAAIRAMAKREIDVLIGTQIIAKGHHFPQLTLVGVIDADLGGSDGDLRARERTFQLLHQVSGRAGRAEKPGLVLLQTRNPADAVMQALARGDRDGFYEQERGYRERVAAPPFGRLAAIVVSGYDGEQVRDVARQLGKAAPARQGCESVGTDAGLLCPAARPDARTAVGAGRARRGCAGLSARLAGAGENPHRRARYGGCRSDQFFLTLTMGGLEPPIQCSGWPGQAGHGETKTTLEPDQTATLCGHRNLFQRPVLHSA